jgi:hypothetical protein
MGGAILPPPYPRTGGGGGGWYTFAPYFFSFWLGGGVEGVMGGL